MTAVRATLESRLRKAVLFPSVVAILVTVAGSQLFGWLNYKDTLERTKADLTTKVTLVGRRISAELLIGARGAPYVVAEALKQELKIQDINLSRLDPGCSFATNTQTCTLTKDNQVFVVTKVTEAGQTLFVSVSSTVPTFRELSPIRSQFWLSLPFLLIIGLATYLQQRQLRQYFLSPINSIIDKTVSGADLPKHWPQEFVQLHGELDEAFQKRDQALIGQITSGVIHDLKTLLQPLSGATQLASEAKNSEAKTKRFEMLFRACERNLPKMQGILEAVLDGNREIRLQARNESIATTITAAIKNASDAAEFGSTVTVSTQLENIKLTVVHDPIQLERALTNLIKNGIEAASLSMNQKAVNVALVENYDGTVQITIEDSGNGLPIPFDQLIASRKSSKLRGTGLGLLVSQKIIEAHQGSLDGGQADLMSGAKFTVVLGGQRT